MRKFTQVALSTGLFAAAVGLVWAAQPGDTGFVPRAYLSTSFGGTLDQQRKGNFFYGMRLDRDATFDGRNLNLPPVVQLAFDRYGMTAASLYGMPFAQRKLTLNQTEGETAAAGTHYTFVDWTLLAVGAVGIGYAISEVVDQKDTKDPASTSGGGAAAGGGSSTGSSTGGGTGGGTGSSTGGATGSSTGGATGRGFADIGRTTPLDGPSGASADAIEEYQQWLDGGTGQMGDLKQH